VKPLFERWVKGLKEPGIVGAGSAGDLQPFPGKAEIEAKAEVEAEKKKEGFLHRLCSFPTEMVIVNLGFVPFWRTP
jgi:hypothetical protein